MYDYIFDRNHVSAASSINLRSFSDSLLANASLTTAPKVGKNIACSGVEGIMR